MGNAMRNKAMGFGKLPSVASLLFERESKDGDVAAAADKLGSLDVSRGPSEVVKFLNGADGSDPRVRALLGLGDEDEPGAGDEQATVNEGATARLGDLVPTQIEIELTKSIGYPLAKFKTLRYMVGPGVKKIGPPNNDRIVVSGDLIVDGHHRWSSLFSVAGPDGVIAAINIDLPEKDAASVLAIVQTAIAATTDGPVPKAKAGGLNILGKGKDEIAGMIRSAWKGGKGEAGPILTDEFVASCIKDPAVREHFGIPKRLSQPFGGAVYTEENEEDRERNEERGIGGVAGHRARRDRRNWWKEQFPADKMQEAAPRGNRKRYDAAVEKVVQEAREIIIERVADNLSQMNKPASGSPPRVDMPQIDKAKGGVDGVMKALGGGVVNYKEPFAVEGRRLSSTRDKIMVERWQRLAGIIR